MMLVNGIFCPFVSIGQGTAVDIVEKTDTSIIEKFAIYYKVDSIDINPTQVQKYVFR